MLAYRGRIAFIVGFIARRRQGHSGFHVERLMGGWASGQEAINICLIRVGGGRVSCVKS